MLGDGYGPQQTRGKVAENRHFKGSNLSIAQCIDDLPGKLAKIVEMQGHYRIHDMPVDLVIVTARLRKPPPRRRCNACLYQLWALFCHTCEAALQKIGLRSTIIQSMPAALP
ncbi:hypothetical protein [Thauera linaloolentis]|uniref:hypothetical protein n=1 Tax=Thauera linaloolentis TaxID=76112 RepID=UPI0012B5EABB|nr:hypothetical protein [Thauera linaloolentis]MCM8564203.1 hypothetical protein [Thauera linaloolentis]